MRWLEDKTLRYNRDSKLTKGNLSICINRPKDISIQRNTTIDPVTMTLVAKN